MQTLKNKTITGLRIVYERSDASRFLELKLNSIVGTSLTTVVPQLLSHGTVGARDYKGGLLHHHSIFRNLPHIRESKKILDWIPLPGFWIPGAGFRIVASETWIPHSEFPPD